jgi:hypothetical protein
MSLRFAVRRPHRHVRGRHGDFPEKMTSRGACDGSQPMENMLGLIIIFPEDGLTWESSLHKASFSLGGLPVGFGFGAATPPLRHFLVTDQE